MEELSDSQGGPEEQLDHFAEAVERSAKDAERLMESVVKARSPWHSANPCSTRRNVVGNQEILHAAWPVRGLGVLLLVVFM